jgi:hypothetical protein
MPPALEAVNRCVRAQSAREWWAWLAAAFAARLAFGWLAHPATASALEWLGDDGYDELAQLWLAGRGYVRWEGGPPSLERLPLYPALLAALFRLGGQHGPALAFVVQSALSALTLVPLAALAGRLGGPRACRLACGLWLLHPVGYLYNFRFMSEPLHLLLAISFLWASASWIERGGAGRASLSGALLGGALLTRSALAPLVPLLLGAAGAAGRLRQGASPGAVARDSLLALASGALVISPWLAHSIPLGGGLVSSGAPAAAFHGLAVSRAAWNTGWLGEVDRASDLELEAKLRAALPGLDVRDRRWDTERARLARRLAREEFAVEPLRRAAETFRNLSLAWFLTYTPRGTAVAAACQIPLLIAAAAALRRRGRRWPAAWAPALALAAGQTILQALVYPHFRFMSPATCVILALVAGAAAAGDFSAGPAPVRGLARRLV